MENQGIPPFPFDAMDGSFDGSDFDPAEFLSTASGGEQSGAREYGSQATMQMIRRKLQELDEQIRSLLLVIDHDLVGAPTPAIMAIAGSASGFDVAPARTRMISQRVPEPISLTGQDDDSDDVRVIEGVFDGQNMVGPDGKQYSVPSNYSSKSKLVEGDILKLRITPRGAFVYKQVGPIARERQVGVLERDDVTGEYVVIVPDAESERSVIARAVVERQDLPTSEYRRYRILRASVTYYKGGPGDEVVVLVPKDAPSTWAAVENIIKH
ncbi:MAG: hypothetical protein ABIG71_04755 [Candidatus Uhrbacteria bacterium]